MRIIASIEMGPREGEVMAHVLGKGFRKGYTVYLTPVPQDFFDIGEEDVVPSLNNVPEITVAQINWPPKPEIERAETTRIEPTQTPAQTAA